MLNNFLVQLEKRTSIPDLISRFSDLFQTDSAQETRFSDQAFSELLGFLEKGDPSYQGVAVQAGVRWSASSQRVALRNALVQRGFLTPSCLWAYKQMRGSLDALYKDFPSSEMSLMQILVLKESDPELSIPFLIEKFLTRRELPEELRTASRLCVLRLLDSGVAPELLRSLQCRYQGVEILRQWRPSIPGGQSRLQKVPDLVPIDFYQLVRSVHDIKEFSSLTRTIYLLSLFYVPVTEKEWKSLWLSRTDQLFLERLQAARMVEKNDGGLLLATDLTKQSLVKKFLYESYSLAKDSVRRNRAQRINEERQRRVRSSELDRQALEIVPDGIISVDGPGFLYYTNPAAEKMLSDNKQLKERLFGVGSLEESLSRYSRDTVISRIAASIKQGDDAMEIFGDRIIIRTGEKRFEVELGAQVILLRDTTDQHLIDEEIGKLYRHELKAALEVVGVGLDMAKQLVTEGRSKEAVDSLQQVEEKRVELFSMLEERIDFIRLHSDAFQIRPATINLNLVVDRCVSNYREAASGKRVAIKSNHLHTPAVFVRGEDCFLVRAVDNIIRNAVKFSKKGGPIKVSVGSQGFEAFVRVEDSGPGIPPENLGKIFQLGFTTGGTGRGLYLARRIVVAHNGRIEVKSSGGQGACFALFLPLLTEA